MPGIGDFIRKMAFDAAPGDAGRKVTKALGGRGDESDDQPSKLAKGVKKQTPLGKLRPDGRVQLMGDD